MYSVHIGELISEIFEYWLNVLSYLNDPPFDDSCSSIV